MKKTAFIVLSIVMPIACLWVSIRLFEDWGALAVLVCFVALAWLWRFCRERDIIHWLNDK